MFLVRKSVMATAMGMAMLLAGREVLGAERPVALTLEGGIVALTLGLELEVQTPWGIVAGAGAGVRGGPAVNGYIGYDIPLGDRWGFRPGFRADILWQENDVCPRRCVYESLIGEATIRYRGPSGFAFEYGLPIFGWVPVGPTDGEKEPHLEGYSIATSELTFYSTVLVGYSF